MDIRVKIYKPPSPCQHVTIEYMTEKGSFKRTYLLSDLKDALTADSFGEAEQMILGQIKKLILENPQATIAELKTLVESEVFKI